MALTLAELNLVEPAMSFATQLQRQCPGVIFVRGRATRESEALAIAGNVVLDRRFVDETYADSVAKRAVSMWIDAHPQVTDKDGLAEGILGVLLVLSDDEYSQLTHHGAGEALDIRPWSCPRTAVEALAHLYGGKFLDHEGKLSRWHIEFKDGGPVCQ